MSTSNVHQQSLADAGSETSRPPMLERGPYEFRIFTPSETEAPRLQKEEDLRGDDLKHYEAEIEAMNLILISIVPLLELQHLTMSHIPLQWLIMMMTIKEMLNQAIVQGDRVNIQSRNFGNDGRNTRCSHVQEEVIEGNNVQNDAGNTQRTLQTSSLQELLQNYIVTTVVRKVEFLGMVIWKFLFAQQHDMYELEGDYLLTGAREYNLYTISILDMATSSPVCLMSKATLTKSWLWHRRLSHLNFGFIDDSSNNSMNTLSKEDLDDLFEAMYDEYFKKKSSDMPIHSAA
ncbi:integrase, catalytic region, zinc finger, CCHC-type containing protein [Tanacetum coccineum]|uniref:Integrase, catalytic region, zinc finger, CCHC-type containing protein n=1 Tax=Tanacetum coccineum TaxID=301880 RepID=A0ABQ5E1H4_9ASTR